MRFFMAFARPWGPQKSKSYQKGPKREPKGAKKEPKGNKKEPKWSQNGAKERPKCIKKSSFGKGRENERQKAAAWSVRVSFPGPATFLAPFFATSSEDRFLDAFWSAFGSLLAPFWLPLAPFASLLLPFGSLFALFGTLWATFWLQLAHFWRFSLTFGSFGGPFSHV